LANVTRSIKVIIEDYQTGEEVARFEGKPMTIASGKTAVLAAEQRVEGVHFWSWGYGYLYRVKTIVGDDEVVTTIYQRST
jgi:beta-galactosidase/beta-glucuronidase